MAADGIPGPRNQPQFLAGGAPDLGADENAIADYAAKVGNRRVGTTAERLAATGLDVWEGLSWRDATDGITYDRVGTGWVAMSSRSEAVVPLLGAFLNQTYPLTTTERARMVTLHGRVSRASGTLMVVGTVDVAHRPPTLAAIYRVGSVGSGNTVGGEFFVTVGTNGTITLVLLGGTFDAGTYITFNLTWAI